MAMGFASVEKRDQWPCVNITVHSLFMKKSG